MPQRVDALGLQHGHETHQDLRGNQGVAQSRVPAEHWNAEAFGQGFEPPFRFRGNIERVRVITGGANADPATELDAFMRQQ